MLKRAAIGDFQSAFVGVGLAVGSADWRPVGRTEDRTFGDEAFRSGSTRACVIQVDLDAVFLEGFARCSFEMTFIVVGLTVTAAHRGVNGWTDDLCKGGIGGVRKRLAVAMEKAVTMEHPDMLLTLRLFHL